MPPSQTGPDRGHQPVSSRDTADRRSHHGEVVEDGVERAAAHGDRLEPAQRWPPMGRVELGWARRAYVAVNLRDDDVGRQLGQPFPVDRIEGLVRAQLLIHQSVDLAARPGSVEGRT